jgi:hypothetical protein
MQSRVRQSERGYREASSTIVWLTLAACIGTVVYVAAPHSTRFPAALVSLLAFSAVLIVFPAARPIRQPVLCPLNWTLLVFFFQLVVVPLLLCFFGPFPNTLPLMPADRDINLAVLISVVSFTAFAIGCALSLKRTGTATLSAARAVKWPASRILALVFAAIGVLGILISFGGVAQVVTFYENPGSYVGTTEGATNALLNRGAVAYTAGVVLKPFLGIAVVIAWCAWVESRKSHHGVTLVFVTLLTGAAIAASYGTFSYNRGAFVAPLIALAAVYGRRVRRIPLSAFCVAGVVLLLFLTLFQSYRTQVQDPRSADLSVQQAAKNPNAREQILQNADVNEMLQVYGGGPQYLAFLLDQTGYASNPHYGRTVLSSLVYPVPVLGRPYRASSGVQIYNQLIYGRTGNIDQVVPFQGELFLDFQLPGVIIGYVLLGLAVMFLQRRFLEAPTALQSFAWQYAATWLAFLVIGSVAVVSQVFIYFFLPIYALAFWSRVRSMPPTRSRPTGLEARPSV